MSASVTLVEVTKQFPGSAEPALSKISLDVAAGSCTAILGPSGSGKSTILRVIAGLDEATGGRVLIGGHDVGPVPAERRGVGMVFQKSLLFPHLSVLDNVAFSQRVAGAGRAAARRRASEFLDMVQLGGFGARRVTELSGGQEQRVAIARALAAEPAVLLLDEPFSALDPALRSDMHALIDEVRLVVSPTIVLVTHDRDEASTVADRIAVIERGELLQHDTVAGLYTRPANLRVARLMGGLNEVPGTVARGYHHSAIGATPVPAATPEGPGTLVIRQESVLVADPAPHALPTAATGEVVGRVADVRTLGARSHVRVQLTAGIVLSAEQPTGHGRREGDPVALTLPREAVCVVPR